MIPRWLILLAPLLFCELACSKKEPPQVIPIASAKPSAHPQNSPHGPPSFSSVESTTEIYGWGGVPSAFRAKVQISTALSSEVLHQLFPKYLTSENQCPTSLGTLEQARIRGDIVPKVQSVVVGAFSRPGAQEQLLGVLVGECGATHADNWGSQRLILWAQGKILRDLALQEGAIEGAVDLDGDGRREILLSSGGTGQGITTTRLLVARLEEQGLVKLADLGIVYEGNCGAQDPEGEEVSVVTAVKNAGATLDFNLRKEKRPCRELSCRYG